MSPVYTHLNLPPQTGEEVGGDVPAGRVPVGRGWVVASSRVGGRGFPPPFPARRPQGTPLRFLSGRLYGSCRGRPCDSRVIDSEHGCGGAREDPHLNLPPKKRPLHKSQLPPQSRPNYPDSHLRPSKNWRSVEGRETFMQRSRRRGKRWEGAPRGARSCWARVGGAVVACWWAKRVAAPLDL